MSMDEQFKQAEKVYEPALAASLLLSGYNPLFAGIDSEGRAVFGFKKTEGLGEVIESYWEDTLKVTPRELFDMIQVMVGVAYGARELT